jgi:hypothetical protein
MISVLDPSGWQQRGSPHCGGGEEGHAPLCQYFSGLLSAGGAAD